MFVLGKVKSLPKNYVKTMNQLKCNYEKLKKI